MTEPRELVLAWSRGEAGALDRLFPLVYRELRRIAGAYLRGERRGQTLQPTALVHEAYLRLLGRQKVELENQHQLMALLAQTMRRVLIDQARRKKAAKRRSDLETALETAAPEMARDRPTDLIHLDRALARLAELDARQAQVVELRYFGGYSIPETAAILDLSPATVKRDWSMARAWLYHQLRDETE